MKKSAIIGIIILAAAIIISLFIFISGEDTVDTAINEYESGDYIDAIVILNRLIPAADYDEAEKMHYYRCKSLNSLAEELESDYDDELEDASLENREKPDFEKYKEKIESKLAKINSETGGDLSFYAAPKKSMIISKGIFYNEFTAKYRGSQFIEDLDFHELKKIISIEPTRIFDHVNRFYKKYPGSSYIPQIITIVFNAIRDGATGMEPNRDFLKNMILGYAVKYPTSQEVTRLYTSAGDSVNLRNSPGVQGTITGKTVDNELLIQLEKSMDTMQVGDTRDYWYRVATLRGVRGWIFGKFLAPIDIQKIALSSEIEVWALDDSFETWSDSNTPENWAHIPGADTSAINFKKESQGNLLVYNSRGIGTTGLYSRFNVSRNFRMVVRARFISGSQLTLAAYAIDRDNIFSLKLENEKIDVNGRSIPLHTTDWHNYEITSDNGKFATLSIDGQLVSGRIPPATENGFNERGIYLLNQRAGGLTSCEVEFIRIR
ncbi:MAG TPA: SH3 domain-containing protein [Spirochaetota bacterium]|nr:SH3 domain-containing protein [Spirochaetota bacterium]